MRINRLVLENYGLYSGRNEIELSLRRQDRNPRPIILIGGMNGAGKTTLLEAIRLSLYGKTALGDRISEKRYHDRLRELIYRSANSLVQLDYARVGVEFDFVFRGTKETYYVERSWSLRNRTDVDVTLQILKPDSTSRDGDYSTWPALSELEPEHWQAFVKEVVPERLSQLFFFDGEKIERIADDISGDSAVAQAVQSLLGLDTVSRLKTDLAILTTREAKKYSTAQNDDSLQSIALETERMEKALYRVEQKKAELVTTIHGVEAEIAQLERQLQEEGGAFGLDRPSKQARIELIERDVDTLRRKIRHECEGLFPLSLCERTGVAMAKQLLREEKAIHSNSLRDEMDLLQRALIKNLSHSTKLSKMLTEEVIQTVTATFVKHREKHEAAAPEILIGFSATDTKRVLNWLHESRLIAAERMRDLCVNLERKEREIQDLHRQLQRAPEQSVLAPIFRELTAHNKVLGQKQAELKALQDDAASLQSKLVSKERERKKIEKQNTDRVAMLERHKLGRKVQDALDIYLSRLTEMKIRTMCQTVTECFNRLASKEDLLRNISINPKTFEVLLHDRRGHTLARKELSAGEKQILAIAILWGLAKTSGRPLPVIIDTPLGRLDSDHRMNLVRHYFPYAAHQVILLSTDTEVDKKLFMELRSNVSHCYHLVYDGKDQRTTPKQEYFWRVPNEA